MIITDDISHFPILDFDDYVNALTNIIKNSYPKFSIGIYGEWGTGKTTLMRSIYDKLKDNNEKNLIIPVWFNAWRYEREEQFAIIPLLKTIAYGIPDKEQFQDLKQKLRKGGMNFLRKIPDIIPSIVGSYFGEGALKITEEAINAFKKEFIPKLELLAEVDKETIYFDGVKNIEQELQEIRNKIDFKIVVFVDDLDRCSPDKALQVLESIKVFLDIDGFIYVIGLSHNKISQLITAYYKEKYKELGIEGDQYLKKIIQIPIILSDWNSDDVKTLIQDFIKNKVIQNEGYQKIIDENIELISTGLEENPREAKRFLNNFIVAQEIFAKKGTKPKELLILQILSMRWNEIYRLIVNSNGKFLEKLKPYVENKEELKKLATTKPEDTDLQPEMRILQKLRTDQKFWIFLETNYEILNNISDWKYYRRATKISDELITNTKEFKNKVLKLLNEGNVNGFNDLVLKFYLTELDLTGANLPGANLPGANLPGANLGGADLRDSDLRDADLSGANLPGANLNRANLNHANLLGANLADSNLVDANVVDANLADSNLRDANLAGANLSGADLSAANLINANLRTANLINANLARANLAGANLPGANLSYANLEHTIIINPRQYETIKLNKKTKFDNAVIDDDQFIDYINKFTNNLPEKIYNKRELKIKLEEKELSDENIKFLLELSKIAK